VLFSLPQPGCYLQKSPWPGKFPSRESLVSNIQAGDWKNSKSFFTVYSLVFRAYCLQYYENFDIMCKTFLLFFLPPFLLMFGDKLCTLYRYSLFFFSWRPAPPPPSPCILYIFFMTPGLHICKFFVYGTFPIWVLFVNGTLHMYTFWVKIS
jgi:hypothetical protein